MSSKFHHCRLKTVNDFTSMCRRSPNALHKYFGDQSITLKQVLSENRVFDFFEALIIGFQYLSKNSEPLMLISFTEGSLQRYLRNLLM